ncbi:MAG: DinB family protein [bacterium]|nr:DinB family protein [bacterium]
MSQVEKIADQLKRAVYGDAWHGPSVLENLEGVTAKQAINKPIPNAHSIWEITLHITAWFRIVAQRLEGEDPEVTREIDWPAIEDPSAKAWVAAVADIKRAYKEYQKVVDKTMDNELFVELPGRGFDLYHLYHGMVQHCTYHAGQIAILKKAQE